MASSIPAVTANRQPETTSSLVGNNGGTGETGETSGFAELLAALSIVSVPQGGLQNLLNQITGGDANLESQLANIVGQSNPNESSDVLSQLFSQTQTTGQTRDLNGLLNQLAAQTNTTTNQTTNNSISEQNQSSLLETLNSFLQQDTQTNVAQPVPTNSTPVETQIPVTPTVNPTSPQANVTGGRTLQNPTPVPAAPIIAPNTPSSLVAPETFIAADPVELPVQEIQALLNFGFSTNNAPSQTFFVNEAREMVAAQPLKETEESLKFGTQEQSSEKVNLDRLIFQAQMNELQTQERSAVPKKAQGSGELSTSARVANEIVTRAEMITQGANTEFRVRLDPPELGTIQIRMQLGPEGLRAEMTVSSDAVRQLMEQQMPDLQQRLQAANLHLVKFDIQQEQDRQDQQRSWYQQQPQEEEATPANRRSFNPRVTPLPTRGALLDIRA